MRNIQTDISLPRKTNAGGHSFFNSLPGQQLSNYRLNFLNPAPQRETPRKEENTL